ncbi:hypothetical protein [Microbacterium abyssi]|uniref:hypothetical protein n=1 Tax=Microbacterium abyssi TaxID=2782166 RepID=UPI0018890343|nr:hypothetical protein [Microbacterium sp. A18JL241]
MRIAPRRIAGLTGLAAVSMLLAGCATPAGEPGATPASMDELCAEPLVLTCETGGGTTIIVVPGDAADERVTEFAHRLYDSDAAASGGDIILRGEHSDPRVLDPEVSPPPKWELTVHPGEPEQFEAALSGTLAAAAVPGAVGVFAQGWPHVTVETLDEFDEVFTRLSSMPLFRGGGTYTLQSLDEHLRLVHVPSRTADSAVLEIIGIARDYPAAEVLLEAPESGPQYPALYVSGLTPAQAAELDARLSDPRLATADVDGYALEYVLGSLGEDGTTYLGGTFGGVPAG